MVADLRGAADTADQVYRLVVRFTAVCADLVQRVDDLAEWVRPAGSAPDEKPESTEVLGRAEGDGSVAYVEFANGHESQESRGLLGSGALLGSITRLGSITLHGSVKLMGSRFHSRPSALVRSNSIARRRLDIFDLRDLAIFIRYADEDARSRVTAQVGAEWVDRFSGQLGESDTDELLSWVRALVAEREHVDDLTQKLQIHQGAIAEACEEANATGEVLHLVVRLVSQVLDRAAAFSQNGDSQSLMAWQGFALHAGQIFSDDDPGEGLPPISYCRGMCEAVAIASERIAYRAERANEQMKLEDGPHPPNRWVQNGVLLPGTMNDLAWKLVNHLWDCKGRCCDMLDISEPVYGDHERAVTNNSVGSLRREANKFFGEFQVPLAVGLWRNDVRLTDTVRELPEEKPDEPSFSPDPARV